MRERDLISLLCRTTLISVPITACGQLSFPRSYLFIDLRAVYAHIANCECMYCTPSCTCTSHGPPHHKLSYIRASTK